MEILRFGPGAGRAVEAFGSSGVTAQKVVREDAVHVTVLCVAAGGEIGRHPATEDQLFMVTSGRGSVCGGDGRWESVEAGQAVFWRGGEEHTTRADEDIVAVVVEMASLRTSGPRPA